MRHTRERDRSPASLVARWCAAAAAAIGIAMLAASAASGTAAAQRPPADGADRVLATTIATEITPVVADQIRDGIGRAEDGGYQAYLIELDTPGGLETSMRTIVEDILASRVPVIVYVTPHGARAASAGAVIALASHFAVMAPGTSIGAATPVGMEGGDVEAKVINDAAAHTESLARLRDRDVEFAVDMVREGRSAAVGEAVEIGFVDAAANSVDAALEAADGQRVDVAGERTVTMTTAGAEVDRYDFPVFRSVLQFLANPNVAYILLTLGTLGLIYELASPGVGVGGTVGAVSLILALFGLAVLPVNAVGIVLLLVAAALFAGELFVPGVAGFAFGGAVTLVLAAMFLFDDTQGVAVDLLVALPAAILTGLLVILAGRRVLQAQRRPSSQSGVELLVNREITVRNVTGDGSVDTQRAPRATAFLEGTWWTVRGATPLRDGQRARVTGVDGLTLVVRPVDGDESEE